jgi:hypothetical protein
VKPPGRSLNGAPSLRQGHGGNLSTGLPQESEKNQEIISKTSANPPRIKGGLLPKVKLPGSAANLSRFEC